MKILVYGAGVLGSLYAAKLQRTGNQVTLLARGQRLEELRQNGIRLVNEANGEMSVTQVDLIEKLEPDQAFDLVIVILRKNQLPEVLPTLAANHFTPNVLFMVNNAAGPAALTAALGRHRVLLGFPGAGGARSEGIVRYQLTSFQETTIGELNGAVSRRIQQVAWILREAGFSVAICSDMDAWLKTHVAVVSPAANAVYMAGGDIYRLAHTRDALVLLVRAAREGLRVIRRLGYPITPARIQLLQIVPEPLLVKVLERVLATESAQLMIARHANAARDEMQVVADEFKQLVEKAGLATPAMDRLAAYIDPQLPPMDEGKRTMPLNWRGVIVVAGLLTAIGIIFGWLCSRRRK